MSIKTIICVALMTTAVLGGCSATSPVVSPPAYTPPPSPPIPAYQQAGTTGQSSYLGEPSTLTLTRDANAITVVTADGGTSLRLPYQDTLKPDAYGIAASIYSQGYDPQTGPQGETIIAFDGAYSSLVAFSPNQLDSLIGMGVVGQSTQDMPLQRATYSGVWLSNIYSTFTGDFKATADFASKIVDYEFNTEAIYGTGSANITGSTFSGTMTTNLGGTGTTSGGFFGPQASEMAGVSSIRIDNIDFDGAFLAQR